MAEVELAFNALRNLESGAGTMGELSHDALRSCHALLVKWQPAFAEAIRIEDERELADARAKVAAIEARMGVKPPSPPRPEKAESPKTDYDETDAGQGIGAEPVNVSAESFTDELKALREHTQAKRARRG